MIPLSEGDGFTFVPDAAGAAAFADAVGLGGEELATGFAPALYVVKALAFAFPNSWAEHDPWVHAAQEFRFHRPLRLDSPVTVRVNRLDHGDHGFRRGTRLGFDVVRPSGELAVEGTTTLTSGPATGGPRLSSPGPLPPPGASLGESTVLLAPDLPVRYAEASGDRNPLHLDAEFARTHGFPDAVVHGMATVCVALGLARHHVGSTSLRALRVRLARPVHPGSRLRVTTCRTARPDVFRVKATVAEFEVLKDFEVEFGGGSGAG
ncbi:hypothetical protein ALI22I_00705 [Saccharothrix sp. ALI-22-I]|uniref:MaoC family dehydratase n=1 Tax=Saccharothrix sp. ALI-22-I TaxID=1933778 RepID=UPI00097C084A|nr:MaoC/PaaZ C-terminal domain-containing protein [Saccharothrix sp. ALI-22-I]ONI92986.1 hypothetical protein ALI22I_00705 [Saccharothrix sp. ALI-22-I]